MISILFLVRCGVEFIHPFFINYKGTTPADERHGQTVGRANFPRLLTFSNLNYIYNKPYTGNNNNIKYKD